MLESSLVYIITRTFPESIVVVLSGIISLGINIDKEKVLKYGICLGFIISVIRLLPINFGVHSILSMIAVWIILFKNANNDIIKIDDKFIKGKFYMKEYDNINTNKKILLNKMLDPSKFTTSYKIMWFYAIYKENDLEGTQEK